MKMSQAFPSKFLAAADLNGNPVQATISNCVTEEIGLQKEVRPVIYFQGCKKGLVLNKTNAGNIVALYGDDSDGWVGKVIEIYPTTTDFQGKTVDCLRVRAPSGEAAAPVTVPGTPPPAFMEGDVDESDPGGSDIPF